MNNQDYEQKKRECWKEFIGNDGIPTERLRACLDFAFDRAYALGKLQASYRQVNVDSSHDNVDSSHGNVDSLEPKPAEPKYHKDDKVLYNGAVHKITVGYGDGRYLLNNTQKVVKESDLEPYTEPTSGHIADVRNMMDETAKSDSSRKERLRIAAMLAAGMLANDYNFYPIDRAIELADKLIAKCEEGGSR